MEKKKKITKTGSSFSKPRISETSLINKDKRTKYFNKKAKKYNELLLKRTPKLGSEYENGNSSPPRKKRNRTNSEEQRIKEYLKDYVQHPDEYYAGTAEDRRDLRIEALHWIKNIRNFQRYPVSFSELRNSFN